MKQLVITRHGPPEVLAVREARDPTVEPGKILIRVKAAGLNFSDLLARQGLYPDAPRPPAVMGYEVSGTVEAVGTGAGQFKEGMPVIALTRFAGQSELVLVPPESVFPLPGNLTFEQGAAFPVVYLTAHHLLTRVAGARRGETVLLHAAAGGVGLAVAELAKIFGLRVIGLASAAKHDVLRAYGVEPLDSRDPGWDRAVRSIAPGGVDIALDAVGGDSWRRDFRLLAPVGRLVGFGASSLVSGTTRNPARLVWQFIRWPRFHMLSLLNQNKTVAGVNLGHLWSHAGLLRPQVEALLNYAREGSIAPRVDRTFSLEEGPEAHRYIHERRNIGKVVFRIA